MRVHRTVSSKTGVGKIFFKKKTKKKKHKKDHTREFEILLKAPNVSFSKAFYPHCSVLVGSRNI